MSPTAYKCEVESFIFGKSDSTAKLSAYTKARWKISIVGQFKRSYGLKPC
jgi:hypothetical protein